VRCRFEEGDINGGIIGLRFLIIRSQCVYVLYKERNMLVYITFVCHIIIHLQKRIISKAYIYRLFNYRSISAPATITTGYYTD